MTNQISYSTIISSRLKKALEIKNLKQADLVNLTGLGKSAISQYISGKVTPKQDKISIIARALNINELWLMGIEDNMYSSKNDDLPELTAKDEREIESDLEDMMHSVASASCEGDDDFEDIEAFKAAVKVAMVQAKRIAKKKYTPKKYRKE